MKRILVVLQTLLIPLMMSAQIDMYVNGRAELDPNDTDARSYYAMKDINDMPCAIIKVTPSNPVNGTLVLQTKGGVATVKTQRQENGEWWFWVSPVVTNIMFSCEGYTSTPYIGVNLQGKMVYRLKLTVGAAVTTVTTFTLGESVMKLNVTPPDATVFYGRTPDCDMGSRTLTDGLFEAFLDKGTYYYRVESRFYEAATGKYEVADNSPEVGVSLKPSFSYLSLNSDPQGAEVYVNGRLIGTTPIDRSDRVRKGADVRVEFRKADYYIEPVTVNVVGDGKVQVVPTVHLRPQFGWVTCLCDDPEAELTVSDATKVIARGKSGMRVKLNSGGMTYKLESARPSHIPQAQGIKGSTIEGKSVELKVDNPVPIFGGLQIVSVPSRAKVYIDGEEAGVTAFSKRVLVGEHTVELKLDGYHLDPFKVQIVDGQTVQLSKELIQGPHEVWAYVKTATSCHLLMDGVKMGDGNAQWVKVEVGRKYHFTSVSDISTLKSKNGHLDYVATSEDGQDVVVPGAEVLYGTVKVTTGSLTGANINLNGPVQRDGTSPFTSSVPVGSYTVEATKSGYRKATGSLTVKENKTSTLNLSMRKDVNFLGWKWSWEETDFAKHFLDTTLGFSDGDVGIGLHYAYCSKHLGGYGQTLYFGDEDSYTVSGGVVIRMTWDYRKVDWQLYGGPAWVFDDFGWEIGTRLGWRSGSLSWFDFGVGLMSSEYSVVPTINFGLGITLTALTVALAAMGAE